MKDIFLDRYPQIDLHGLDRDSARMVTNDFVLENVMLGNQVVVIVHGKGMGINMLMSIRQIILMMGQLW